MCLWAERTWAQAKEEAEDGQSPGTSGLSGGRYREAEKAASLRQPGVGDPSGRGRFPAEMFRLRSSDHDRQKAGGKEYPGNPEKAGNTAIGDLT